MPKDMLCIFSFSLNVFSGTLLLYTEPGRRVWATEKQNFAVSLCMHLWYDLKVSSVKNRWTRLSWHYLQKHKWKTAAVSCEFMDSWLSCM